MGVDAEDAFQKELTELFVQEAREWLQQIHVALDELQQGPASDRHLKLAQSIKAGITNLGGSAATIGLSDVERASFAALPFVAAVEDPAAPISANDFIILCKQLGHIHSALTRATGMTFEAEPAEVVETPPLTLLADELLGALKALDDRLAPAEKSRNVIRTVMAQIHGMMANGMTHCDVTSLREFLTRSADADRMFAIAVREQLPAVSAGLAELRRGTDHAGETPDRLKALQDQVGSLWTAAQQVNAGPAMTFFMGLHAFLGVVLQRRVGITPQRYEAIEAKAGTMLDVVQGWMETGRAERAAVEGVLPAHV